MKRYTMLALLMSLSACSSTSMAPGNGGSAPSSNSSSSGGNPFDCAFAVQGPDSHVLTINGQLLTLDNAPQAVPALPNFCCAGPVTVNLDDCGAGLMLLVQKGCTVNGGGGNCNLLDCAGAHINAGTPGTAQSYLPSADPRCTSPIP